MLKIAICDDDGNELNKTNEMCHNYKICNPVKDISISSFSSPLELKLSITKKDYYDIYLLDIYMPEMTGTEFARFLRERKEECQIIFLTTSVNHAIEAFSLHATHYLLKPYKQEQLNDALNKAIGAIEKKNAAQITVKTSEGLHRISFTDFLYSETDKHIQHIYLLDGKCLTVRITSAELFELLSFDNRFYKCGSTYIINVGKVDEINKNNIVFYNGSQIPMQRRQYKELIERYTTYALEGN